MNKLFKSLQIFCVKNKTYLDTSSFIHMEYMNWLCGGNSLNLGEEPFKIPYPVRIHFKQARKERSHKFLKPCTQLAVRGKFTRPVYWPIICCLGTLKQLNT